MTTPELEAVGLKQYPFLVVPPAEPTAIWADRAAFRERLDSIVTGWSLKPSSGIYLMWADFGAGKTHALRYLQFQAEGLHPGALTIYTDVSEGTPDFRRLFEQIAPRISESALSVAIIEHRRRHGDSWLSVPWLQGDRDTPRALWVLADMPSEPMADATRKWLRGERLTQREASQLGVTGSIRTSEDAVRVLSTISRLLVESRRFARVVMLLDEFQRVGQISKSKLRDVNAGISTLFNRCPEGLAIVLSYSFAIPDHIRFMVAPELMSRVSEQLQLSLLGHEDATAFVVELLAIHSTNGDSGSIFTADGVRAIVMSLLQQAGPRITPRLLLQTCSGVLDGAMRSAETFPIGATTALRLCQSLDSRTT